MNGKTILMAMCLVIAATSARARDAASSLVYIGTRGTAADVDRTAGHLCRASRHRHRQS